MTALTARQTPTPAEEAQARAYLTGIAAGLGIGFDTWTGHPDATASAQLGDGAALLYTGDELHPFDLLAPCPGSHSRHRAGVTSRADIARVLADTAECDTAEEPPADTPTLRLRPPAQTTTPLWLITQAANTPGLDRRLTA